MHADARKLLWDAQQAAERIARFTVSSRVTRIRVDARPGAEVKTLAGDGEIRAGDEDVDRLMEALPTGPT